MGTLVSFRVGEADASLLEREFGRAYTAAQLTDLGNHEVCVKLLRGGVQLEPFLGQTLPPLDLNFNRRENLIRRSREKYATPRAVVEDKIRRWMGTNDAAA